MKKIGDTDNEEAGDTGSEEDEEHR